MPKSREHEPARIKEHLSQRGKEQITNVDNSRTDEKMVTTKPEAEKTEAPKKKKNIITHRMQVTVAKTDRNVRHQIKNRLQDRSRNHRL